ncbi:unnamed protein product [Haemonchus placei]|uniref:Secreted protein n=1 Tax=Haemonchus placei TaxID=6290 RepID=A0A0N4W7Y3_HAEPC|nr:unnamed protein product [Haemonchus placei]
MRCLVLQKFIHACEKFRKQNMHLNKTRSTSAMGGGNAFLSVSKISSFPFSIVQLSAISTGFISGNHLPMAITKDNMERMTKMQKSCWNLSSANNKSSIICLTLLYNRLSSTLSRRALNTTGARLRSERD